MTYIRKMKDGSEKIYYSSSEMKEKLHKSILEHGNNLIMEIRKEKSEKQNFFNKEKILISNEFQYV